MAGWRKWGAMAGGAMVVALVLAGGLEKERRAEGGADGALLKDGWRIRLASARVAEEISARSYAQRMEEYSAKGTLDNLPYATELVGSVAEPLIVAAKTLYPQTRDWAWEWHLADTGEVNAYCMPGGRMVVLSGLLSDEILGDDRDMLATILAHEVSHAILQHSREALGRAGVAQGLAWTVAKSLKIGALREHEMIKGLKSALLDPRSRMRESEADVLGLELMARAGFDPAKAVATWERMAGRLSARAQGKMAQRAIAFLSDHPSDSDRLARMRALQPKAVPLAAKGKRWEWTVQGIDDRQAESLEKAATAFGLGAGLFSVTEHSEVTQQVAKAEGIAPKAAAAELEKAVWDTGLSQGGAVQIALSAMLRGIGGWERLARVEQAWTRLGTTRGLYQEPALVARLDLSDDDRAHTFNAVKRIDGTLRAEGFIARLWRDVAAEIGKTRPKAAAALRSWLDGINDGRAER